MIAQAHLVAHCQMPCGIYHDNMVYDQIDQYAEAMYKAVSEISSNPANSPKDRNQLVRWVLEKEKESDVATHMITSYFLQQRIKPGEEGTIPKVVSAQKLLYLIVKIKQNTDKQPVFEFMEEWENFKNMFPHDGYKSSISPEKINEWKVEHQALKNYKK